MSNRGLKISFIYNAIFNVVNLLFPFISFQYVLHVLGPAGIGKAQFALSFAQYFIIIAAVGIPVYGIREIARCRADKDALSRLFSELFIINGVTSVLLSFGYLLTIYSFDYFNGERPMYIAGIAMVFLSFLSIEWAYTGLSNFKTLAVRTLITRSFTLIAILIFVRSINSYYNFFLINVCAVIAGNAINVVLIRRYLRLTVNNLNLERHLKPLLLVFGLAIGSSMYTVLDTVLLGFLTSAKFIGLYTCAVKFSKMFTPLIAIIGTVLMPEISKRITQNDLKAGEHLLKKSFEFIVFLSIPFCFGFYIWAPEFILAFSGKEYVDAIITLRILSILPFLLGMGYFFSAQILFPAGLFRDVFVSVMIGLGLFITLNLILVPRMLHNGAALANIVTEFVVTLLYIFFVWKRFTFKIRVKLIVTTSLSCLMFFPIAYAVRLLQLQAFQTLLIATLLGSVAYILSQWFIFKSAVVNHLMIFITRVANQALKN
jgi:O-antigen/teichoic acid export membrane protein